MSEHSFDPEVVALLDEIARSSSSTLLRTPKERLLRWVGRPEEVLSPHGSYLSKAEKHLVGAYREQAASVLYAACIDRLASRPETGVFVESSRRPDMREINSRASRLAQGMSSQQPDGLVHKALLNHTGLSASGLATISLRLVPADPARIALGASYHVDGLPFAAMRMFEQVLSGRPSSNMRSIAHDNRGSVQCALRNYSRALESYVAASRAAVGRWKVTIVRMTVALQLGEKGEAVHSAEALAGMDVKTEWLNELIQFFEQTRRAKKWVLTPQAERAICELHDSLPEVARRVCNALHPIDA
ncbi:MAG: hypothetical protein HOP15_16905 [Planctomycetes bacterium]|nr:hypothetical protein [Planctomycetota bacterium]